MFIQSGFKNILIWDQFTPINILDDDWFMKTVDVYKDIWSKFEEENQKLFI